MKVGYTFVRIRFPKFLAVVFRPNSLFFRPKGKMFLAEPLDDQIKRVYHDTHSPQVSGI
jgi:hypothetical protein